MRWLTLAASVVFILAMAAIAGTVFYVVMVVVLETQNKRTLRRLIDELERWEDEDE